MNGLPYYKRYPRDFMEGTAGMPLDLKGPYSVLLDLIYVQSGKLPDDPHYISGHLGCSVRKWNSIRKDLIAAGKIVAKSGVISNLRADKERIILSKYQDKQSENASGPRNNKDLQEPRHSHTEPEPDIEKREAKASPKKRGSRLPENWALPRDWGEWAMSEGWAETTIRNEAEKFRDHWVSKPGRDGTKLDWLATWRNWMRNSRSPKVIQGDGYGQSSRGSDRVNAFIAGARGAS